MEKGEIILVPNLNEYSIKQFALELIQFLGWESVFGPDIAPNSKKYNLRISRITSFENDLLRDIIARKIRK
jgi:hypothetical protein